MKKTCIWTNLKTDKAKEISIIALNRFGGGVHEKKVYILPEYEQQFRKFNTYMLRYSKLFLILVLGLPVIPIILTFFLFFELITGTLILFVTGLLTFSIGITFILFPFPTPETVNMFGLKRAVSIVKIMGALVSLFGIGSISLLIWL